MSLQAPAESRESDTIAVARKRKCRYCSRTFTKAEHLKRHQRSRKPGSPCFLACPRHEISGVVETLGSAVTGFVVGQRVSIQPILSDKTCKACRRGCNNLCKVQACYGLSANGGLADYMVSKTENLKTLPAHVSLEAGALVEPFSVAWHAVRMSRVDIEGCSALVTSAGPIGLATIQVLKMKGARQIIVSEPSEPKRALARRFGATHALDPLAGGPSIPLECTKITNGDGVDVAFDCVGKQMTLDQAVQATGPGAAIVNIAIWGGNATITPNAFAIGEKRFVGSAVYVEEDFQGVIEAVAAGQLDPSSLVTTRVPLEGVVELGIKQGLVADSENQVKVVVDLSM